MATFVFVSSAILTAFATASVVFSWAALLTVVPLMVSMMYLSIPVVRMPKWHREARERRGRNLRRASLLAVFEHLSADYALSEDELVRRTQHHLRALQAASTDKERPSMEHLEKATDAELRPVVVRVLAELEAEPTGDDDGVVRYHLPRQRAELAAADAWREGRTRLDEVGKIVYATDDEDDDPLRDEIEALTSDGFGTTNATPAEEEVPAETVEMSAVPEELDEPTR